MHHSNIVRYLGTITEKNFLNVFLEYVATGTLEQIYKRYTPMSEFLIARYTFEILLGLEYLHHRNVIHRDIKSSNILIREDGTA